MKLIRTTGIGTDVILNLYNNNKIVTTPDMVKVSFHSYQDSLTDVIGTIYKQNTAYIAPDKNLGKPIPATAEEKAAEGYVEKFVEDTRSINEKDEYVLAENAGPHMLGVYEGDILSPTYVADMHAFAAGKLGANFEVSI